MLRHIIPSGLTGAGMCTARAEKFFYYVIFSHRYKVPQMGIYFLFNFRSRFIF